MWFSHKIVSVGEYIKIMTKSCINCIYSVETDCVCDTCLFGEMESQYTEHTVLECRCNPPTVYGPDGECEFPPVPADWYCGEFDDSRAERRVAPWMTLAFMVGFIVGVGLGIYQ